MTNLHCCAPWGFIFLWRFEPIPGQSLPSWSFAITLIRHTTLSRTPLGEWSVWHRGRYFVTHDTYNTQTPMPPAASFEPTNPTSEPPQTHALDGADTEIGTGIGTWRLRRQYFRIWKVGGWWINERIVKKNSIHVYTELHIHRYLWLLN
jgi:hypothetical protein